MTPLTTIQTHVNQNGTHKLKHELTTTNSDASIQPKSKKLAPEPLVEKFLERQDSEANQSTVTSYPPMSTSASSSSLASLTFPQETTQLHVETPDIEIEPPRPSCRIFKIDLVPEPVIQRQISGTSPTNVTMKSLSLGALESPRGGLTPKISPRDSDSEDTRSPSIVVPNIKEIFKMKNKIHSMEEGFESGTESDDGYLTLTKGTRIEDIISPPIQKNARKEGVIADTIDQKEIYIETFLKDEE